jgi:3',5'-cyclic-AMP phosphodiesterase
MPESFDPRTPRSDASTPTATRLAEGPGWHRLLQLTDPHLFADPDRQLLGVTTRRSFEAVLQRAVARASPNAVLVLTGDLVHDESADGYHALRHALDKTGLTYYCIPGNHDSLPLMAELLGPAALEEVAVRRLGDWNLLFLDSTVPGREHGRLGQARLAALDDALKADRGPTIIFLHQHPIPIASTWMDRIAVVDGAGLIRLCESHPHVKALVFGHIHQEFVQRHRRFLILGSPSTCVQFMPRQADFAIDPLPPGYREIDLLPDGRIRTRVLRLDDYPEQPDPSAVGY